MSILTRYIAATFLKHLMFTGIALVALVLVANLFGRLERVFASWEALRLFAETSLRGVPGVIEQMQPMMVLLSAMFTFSGLSRNAELTAMKVAGAGPWRLLRPFTLVLIPVIVLAYVNQNYLVAWANPDGPGSAKEPQTQVWRRIGETLFYFDRLVRSQQQVTGVRTFRFESGSYRLVEYDRIESATRSAESWRLNQLTRRSRTPEGWFHSETLAKSEVPRQEFPNVFRPTILDPRHMPFLQLHQEIGRLRTEGHRVAVYLLEWYQKPAALFALAVMALLGMALVQSSPRRGRVGLEASMTILLGVLFWLTAEIFFLLGKGEVIPPIAATWLAHGAFGLVGLVLYRRMF